MVDQDKGVFESLSIFADVNLMNQLKNIRNMDEEKLKKLRGFCNLVNRGYEILLSRIGPREGELRKLAYKVIDAAIQYVSDPQMPKEVRGASKMILRLSLQNAGLLNLSEEEMARIGRAISGKGQDGQRLGSVARQVQHTGKQHGLQPASTTPANPQGIRMKTTTYLQDVFSKFWGAVKRIYGKVKQRRKTQPKPTNSNTKKRNPLVAKLMEYFSDPRSGFGIPREGDEDRDPERYTPFESLVFAFPFLTFSLAKGAGYVAKFVYQNPLTSFLAFTALSYFAGMVRKAYRDWKEGRTQHAIWRMAYSSLMLPLVAWGLGYGNVTFGGVSLLAAALAVLFDGAADAKQRIQSTEESEQSVELGLYVKEGAKGVLANLVNSAFTAGATFAGMMAYPMIAESLSSGVGAVRNSLVSFAPKYANAISKALNLVYRYVSAAALSTLAHMPSSLIDYWMFDSADEKRLREIVYDVFKDVLKTAWGGTKYFASTLKLPFALGAQAVRLGWHLLGRYRYS